MDISELKAKISSMDLNSIYNTSPQALKELTNDFSEPLVRLIMVKAVTIGRPYGLAIEIPYSKQKELFIFLKKAYGICKKRTNPIWSEYPAMGGFPEYFYTMEANIESDRIITEDGSVHKDEYINHLRFSEENKDLFEDLIVPITESTYDKEKETLTVVEKKLDLGEVIDKRAKAAFDKLIDENACSNADIDEMFPELSGKEENEQIADETNNESDIKKDSNLDVVEKKKSPTIFKKQINEKKVIEVVENLSSDKVVGKRRWYVIYRVFKFIEWLIMTNQNDFIEWVESNFGWEGSKEFRGVQSEIIHTNPNKWNSIVIIGKNGKGDNVNIGPDYYNFAVTIRDAFVNTDEDTGEIKDKDIFLNNKLQSIIHNVKWK